MAPVARAANRLRSTGEGLHTCVALHRFESKGHSRRVFPSFCCSLSHLPTSLAPRALTRFLATTEALSPSGHGSSGLPQTMNAVPSPDRDPRFMSLQLLTILSPPKCTNASGRIEFIIFLTMDWSFASGCSPPRLSTTQLPSATDSQCSVRRGLSPRCWCALSGARGELLAAPGRLQATQSCASSSAKAIRVEEGLFFYSGQGVILTPALPLRLEKAMCLRDRLCADNRATTHQHLSRPPSYQPHPALALKEPSPGASPIIQLQRIHKARRPPAVSSLLAQQRIHRQKRLRHQWFPRSSHI